MADPSKRPRALAAASHLAIAGLVLVGLADAAWLGSAVAFHQGLGNGAEVNRLANLHRSYERWEALYWLGNAIAAATFIPWFARAYGNLRRLGVQHVPWSDRWAVGAWFVPFVSMWRPKQIANEIWRGSEPGADVGSERWRLLPVSPVVHWWWGLFLAGGIVATVGAGLIGPAYDGLVHDLRFGLATEADLDKIRTGTVILVVGAAALIAALAFGIVFIHRATLRLESIRRRLILSEPVGGPVAASPLSTPAPLMQPASAPPPPSPGWQAPPASQGWQAPPSPITPEWAAPPPAHSAPASEAPASQGLVSCPECAELVPPRGACRYCGYGFAGPGIPANR
jgi:hypothetical protein